MTITKETLTEFSGLLSGIIPGQLQSWRLLEVLPLFSQQGESLETKQKFAQPLQSLKLVDVPTYGTMVLQNTSQNTLIVPMHIGFFQHGAQNHATSRALVLNAEQELTSEDCFCIQEAQGGLLENNQQRFMMLPLGLRPRAFEKRQTNDYSRLWDDIDEFTRQYGIARGGHLERFLRPYFSRLVPFRHAFEYLPGQIGSAFFIAGKLAGIEVVPNYEYGRELWPIWLIYCYAPAVLLAERNHWQAVDRDLDLEGLLDLSDLRQRLQDSRVDEQLERCSAIENVSLGSWEHREEKEECGLSILDIQQQKWQGQIVKEGEKTVYMSIYCDVIN